MVPSKTRSDIEVFRHLAGMIQNVVRRLQPDDDPDETVRSLLIGILFHQVYHAGQLGLLRRLAGKDGVIG